MRKSIIILSLLCALCLNVHAQKVTYTAGKIEYVNHDPTGEACQRDAARKTVDGVVYTCANGVYAAIGGGGGGSGTVTNSGTLTSGKAIIGNSGVQVKASKLTITDPATTATLTIADNKTLTVSNTLTFTGTDSSSVAFGAGGTVLYSGGALGTPSSGTLTSATGLPLTTGVTGTLPVANGGTNLTAAADDNVMVGNGTTWQTKALTDCQDSSGNHLNYNATTNAFSCGTSSSGSGLTINTSTITGGTTTRLLFDNAGTVGEISGLTSNGSTTLVQTSNAAAAFESGPNGSTNPVFRLVNNTASAATGLSITGNAAGSGVTLTALSSGSNDSINIVSKGTGGVRVNSGVLTTIVSEVNNFSVGTPNGARVVVGDFSAGTPVLWVQNAAATVTGYVGHIDGSNNIVFGSFTAHPVVVKQNNVTALTIDTSANFGFGTATFGTSAAKVLALASGTAPTSQPADIVQVWSSDFAAGDARLRVLSESGARISLGNNALVFATGTTDDTGIKRVAATVTGFTDGGTSNLGWYQWAGECFLAADATSTSATLANLSGCTISGLVSGRKYTFEAKLFASNSVAGEGVKIDFNGGSATSTNFIAQCEGLDSTLTINTQVSALNTACSAATFTGNGFIRVTGSFEPSGSGTFILRFAENSASSGTLTVKRGSSIRMYDSP